MNSQKVNIRIDDSLPNNDKAVDQASIKVWKQTIKVSRTNVFSVEWKKNHGDPLDDDNGDEDGGHKFDQDDFQCDVNN